MGSHTWAAPTWAAAATSSHPGRVPLPPTPAWRERSSSCAASGGCEGGVPAQRPCRHPAGRRRCRWDWQLLPAQHPWGWPVLLLAASISATRLQRCCSPCPCGPCAAGDAGQPWRHAAGVAGRLADVARGTPPACHQRDYRSFASLPADRSGACASSEPAGSRAGEACDLTQPSAEELRIVGAQFKRASQVRSKCSSEQCHRERKHFRSCCRDTIITRLLFAASNSPPVSADQHLRI